MPVVATDVFVEASDTDIESHNPGDWTYTRGDSSTNFLQVKAAGDRVIGSTSRDNVAEWSGAGVISPDHYAEVLIKNSFAGFSYYGAAARCQGAASGDAYLVEVDIVNDDKYIVRIDSGAGTVLASDFATFNVGDIMRIETEGSTIRGIASGSEFGSVTDSTHTGGSFGIVAWGNGQRLDDFEGGNMAELPSAYLRTAPNTLVRM